MSTQQEESEFEAFAKMLVDLDDFERKSCPSQRLFELTELLADAIRASMKKRYPDPDARTKFLNWQEARFDAEAEAYFAQGPSRTELMNKFFQTNYYDYKEVDSLDAMTLQERQPIIPVGRTRGNLYAFYPGGDEMLQTTDLEHKYTCKDKRHFLRDTILGINLDVEPVQASNSRSRRQLNLSEESTKSGESDDFDPSKFQIFRQLGSLLYDRKGNVKQAIEKGGEKAIKKALQKGLWASTGFAVVLDITNGKAGAVYLVYDFWPMDDVGDIHHVSNNFWGFLPDCEEDEDQFSVAKIADSIKDLGIDHQFLMNSMICHEPEIVPAVQVADGLPILRQRVV